MKRSFFGASIGLFILILVLVEGLIFAVDYYRTPKYQSTAKYMVVIDSGDDNLNAYNASVAANHIAELTVELVDTASFIEKVYNNSGLIFNSKEIDKYREMISAEVIKETEIVEVSIINESPTKAQKICDNVIVNLKDEIDSNQWAQKKFNIEILDPPSLPYNPISPDMLRDLAIGFVGLIMIFSFSSLIKD
jgi:capsular polysaccharide biosynthesis protein